MATVAIEVFAGPTRGIALATATDATCRALIYGFCITNGYHAAWHWYALVSPAAVAGETPAYRKSAAKLQT